MNEKTLHQFVTGIMEIAPKLSRGVDLGKGFMGLVLHRGVTFSKAGDPGKYTSLLSDFGKLVGDTKRFSERFIEEKLHDLIVQVIEGASKNQLITHLKILHSHLSTYDLLHTVYIPVAGIAVHQDEPLGAITFRPVTDGFWDELTPSALDSVRDEIKIGMVVSEYSTVAEPRRALERGIEETSRAFEILRFAIPYLFGTGSRVSVGFQGDLLRGFRSHVIISNGRVAHSGSTLAGALAPFNFAGLTETHRDTLGVNVFSSLLAKPSTNDFEDMLLRCLHWFSSSQIQVEVENKFLNLTTVLEVAFTEGGQGSITSLIAERTALLLESTLKGRRALKNKVRDLYARRSAVSHGGRTTVSRTELFDMETIAGALILELVGKANVFDSRKKLWEHIEDMKFS